MLKAGIVESYDRNKRTCMVRIPGVTDNTDALPEAEFCNPLGDKSEHTEIRVLKGDRVWLMFEDNNLMRPVIVGYRPKLRSNEVGWRRWHHDNAIIETDDDEAKLILRSMKFIDVESIGDEGYVQISAPTSVKLFSGGSTIVIDPDRIKLSIGESSITITGEGVDISAPRIDLN